MTWFIESIQSPHTGKASSSRFVAVVAGMTLSACCLFMTFGLFFKDVFAMPLAVTTPLLATMAGAGYMTSKIAGRTKNEPQ